jgi:hypothetical protein
MCAPLRSAPLTSRLNAQAPHEDDHAGVNDDARGAVSPVACVAALSLCRGRMPEGGPSNFPRRLGPAVLRGLLVQVPYALPLALVVFVRLCAGKGGPELGGEGSAGIRSAYTVDK